jgi:hypothetical protein
MMEPIAVPALVNIAQFPKVNTASLSQFAPRRIRHEVK